MTGAACLACEAAYRAGAGYVTAAIPMGILAVVQGVVREATYLPLPETSEGTVASEAADMLAERCGSVDAIAIGPGLTRHPETVEVLRRVIRESPAPLVVDADGLNAFSGHASELADRKPDAVLTPHVGEFARLVGIDAREVMSDRVGHARSLAVETRAVVLLKGHPTVVAAPEGRCTVNPTGGPSLATAGSGDVLTGVIAALLARGLSPADAAAAGAYLHGAAGDLAGRELGEGTTAGDVLARLPAAIEAMRS